MIVDGCSVDARYPRVENPWKLSPAQCRMLQLFSEGLTNNEVAKRIFISGKTVSHQMMRVREKMNARNPLHACLLWDRFTRGVTP